MFTLIAYLPGTTRFFAKIKDEVFYIAGFTPIKSNKDHLYYSIMEEGFESFEPIEGVELIELPGISKHLDEFGQMFL